jgi:diguanylate cyclase (GGDEF)-like protein
VSESLFPKRRERRAEPDPLVDPLTGVASPLGFEQRLSHEWRRARRNGRSLGLLIVDLDDVEPVGDRRGREAATDALREVAHTIAGNIRDIDLVARFDGDEFVVVSPETSANGLRQLAAKLRKRLEGRGLEVSIGRAELEQGDRSPADIVARADVSMHRQKERRRTVRQGAEHRRRRDAARAVTDPEDRPGLARRGARARRAS